MERGILQSRGRTGGKRVACEERPTVGRRVQALIAGLVPGLAHVLVLDRAGAGTALFLAFIVGADVAVAGRYLVEAEWAPDLYTAGWVLAAAAWLGSWLDMARLTVFRDWEKRAALRKQWSSEAVRLYAGGHLQKAGAAFRRCLSLDPRDPDALFWYGCVQARLGRQRRARRAFRRCRKHDLEGRWSFQIVEQERRVAEPRALSVSDTGSFRELGVTESGRIILPDGESVPPPGGG
jgi:hypothetical protein